MLIGYARVSTEDQNLDLQLDALRKAGRTKIFEKKESGRAGTKRPAFEAALAYLRPEDQLVVWKVDRLGRSLREMLDTAHMLQARGIKLRSLTEQVDTETATGRLMFNFLGTRAVPPRTPQPSRSPAPPPSDFVPWQNACSKPIAIVYGHPFLTCPESSFTGFWTGGKFRTAFSTDARRR